MQERGEIVTLAWQEALYAANIGVYRTLYELYKATPQKHGYKRNENYWGMDIQAALAELAVSKYLGVYWSGGSGRCLKDTPVCEVRSSDKPNNCLLIRAHDNPDDKFVLVINNDIPRLRLVGWIPAKDAMQPGYLRAPDQDKRPAAYFVPQCALLPMEGLRQEGGKTLEMIRR